MKLLHRFLNKSKLPSPSQGSPSFSQSGEDRIVAFVLQALRIPKARYLDIGAFDAVNLSNTYALYIQGGSGCCVEANPVLARQMAIQRPRDRVINVAVSGITKGTIDLYVMSPPTISTTSSKEAERLCREEGCQIERVDRVRVQPINEILRENFPSGELDFLSLDIEGNELEILQHLDLSFAKPKVMCIETLTYSRSIQRKNDVLITFLREKGYMVYGDTYINTIFVDQLAWDRR